MPYLYCETHGREREAGIIERQEAYRQEGESLLVTSGTLVSGPWQCDRCNATLRKGDAATLVSVLPAWVAVGLTDYDFGYERGYFAMGKADIATAYGADWPDNSIRHRRRNYPSNRPVKSPPLCALDFAKPKSS